MSFDNIWQWSETAGSNTAIASTDITGATGRVNNGDNAIRAIMSQIITTEGKGTAIASAATLTLSGPERYFHITGSTGPITDIDFTDAVDGRWAWLIFDSTPTITHNATTLILPGGANIVAAAGDRALFIQDSTDNVICLAYVPAAPVVNTLNGQYKFPATQNASTDANTLDDYEEGTFTVTAAFATPGNSSWAYATQIGLYTKIGDMVFWTIQLAATPTIGTGSGALNILGFPFTATGTAQQSAAISAITANFTWPASRSMVAGYIASGSSTINIAGLGTGASGTLFAASNMSTGNSHTVAMTGVTKVA